MKWKIIASIMTLLIISALGSVVVTLYVMNTTKDLDSDIRLQQMESLHRNLVRAVQMFQPGLHSTYISINSKPAYVSFINQAVEQCLNCHYDQEIVGQIDQVQSLIIDYGKTLNSDYATKTSDSLTSKMQVDAAGTVKKILISAESLFMQASAKLHSTAQIAKHRNELAWLILMVIVMATLVVGVAMAMHLIRAIVQPIHALVNGTRMIASGEMGYTIDYQDKTEFGELAAHFNAMSISLKDSYAKREDEIAERKKAEEKLMHDAFHDALTGLPNRALFMDRLQHAMSTSLRRAGTPYYAVLFCDVDRFKVINDSLGHPMGDQLLLNVGRKLIDCVRPGDTVARLGGDEFAILLESIGDLSHAKEVAERVNRMFSAPVTVRGKDIFTSISIGIAIGTEQYERPEQVLRDADIAMYEAKNRGNASYEIFDAKMHANILDRMQLETDLRGAVDRKEFVLYYQPIVDLQTQRVTGFEALVRWDHPKRGLIYPLEFIPLAEETGLINHIGDWVLNEACRELKRLQTQNPMQPPLTMSVNISIKQFAQKDLVSKLSGFLQETEVDPRTLALEITESMIMANMDAAAETMTKLREMGIQLYIDDFGTGHSSLSYLHKFPVNALKIDRTFISKLTVDGANREIITSIISLAKSLHVDVIAEGVEKGYQLSNIKELNCGYCQGFLIAQPMAEDAIDVWIHGHQQN
jgi:diguanylate cyclase (GGDEF)-like protein